MLQEALPDSVLNWLEQGNFAPEDMTNGDVQALWEPLEDTLQAAVSAPLQYVCSAVLLLLLSRIATDFSPNVSGTIQMCTVLLLSGTVLLPITALLSEAEAVVEMLQVFHAAAVPVYVGLFVFLGNAATAAGFGAAAMFSSNAILFVLRTWIYPVLRAFLALSMVSAITEPDLRNVLKGIYGFLKWLLLLMITIFTATLSVQTILQSQKDIVAGKAIKLIASSAIPIVGGAFSDALSTLSAGAHLVKNGAGAFGILAVLLIFLPFTIRVFFWWLSCWGLQICADLLHLNSISSFFQNCIFAVKLLFASVFSCAAISLVTAGILLSFRGGYG